jgi:hypothetical protein
VLRAENPIVRKAAELLVQQGHRDQQVLEALPSTLAPETRWMGLDQERLRTAQLLIEEEHGEPRPLRRSSGTTTRSYSRRR